MSESAESTARAATVVLRRPPQPDDHAGVRDLIGRQNLEILEEHEPSRRFRVHGDPATLAGLEDDDRVLAVLGLTDEPVAQPRFMIATPTQAQISYTPLDLAKVYDFPPGDGTGQTIAIIELGGGFAQSDLDAYFSNLGIPAPHVTAVGVDGAKNVPGKDPNGADGEVLLDIEVAGAIAPKADIVVYFAPNSDAGFVDAISQAAHANPTPTAMSISWGQSEDQWKATSRQAMDGALADAADLGVTVTAAAGDNGSTDRGKAGTVHADFPASSPHVLGCGGTTLHAQGATVTSEVVWDDGGKGGATGGGVSDVFPVPPWQKDVGVPDRTNGKTGRGVPDVAANADPNTGYQVCVDGQSVVIGGTSAVAPLWAGLIARIAQQTKKKVGLAQNALYAGASAGSAVPGIRDITTGNNGAWRAGPGWDACTGLGVPKTDLLSRFGG